MAAGSKQACGLTILRVVVGVVFMFHGYQKLIKMGFHGVAGFFAHSGIPLPMASAVVVTLVEFVGGILLIAGVGTRVARALLARFPGRWEIAELTWNVRARRFWRRVIRRCAVGRVEERRHRHGDLAFFVQHFETAAPTRRRPPRSRSGARGPSRA